MSRIVFASIVAAAASIATAAQPTLLFHFVAKPGPYRVGLKVVDQYDYSRTFRSPAAPAHR